MPELTIEERVAAGAAWLDTNVPGWLDLMNLDRLKLDSDCHCILGQTFGDYFRAPLIEDVPAEDDLDACAEYDGEAWPLGFQSSIIARIVLSGFRLGRAAVKAADSEYAELEAEWRRLILARREAGNG